MRSAREKYTKTPFRQNIKESFIYFYLNNENFLKIDSYRQHYKNDFIYLELDQSLLNKLRCAHNILREKFCFARPKR
jgi:hypothetical protein